MAHDNNVAFSSREFRDALGHFATGIAIVTAQLEGVRIATTVSSFNAVSLEPPLVLFSIARKALSFSRWHSINSFAVMILSERQAELATRFAKSGTDKWQDLTPLISSVGAPLLPEWMACFECVVHARADGGDHEIVIGRVVRIEFGESANEPLLFYRGKYRSLGMEGAVAPRSPDLWLYGW